MKTKKIFIAVAYILVCSTMYGDIEPSHYKNTQAAYLLFSPDTPDTYLILALEIIRMRDVLPKILPEKHLSKEPIKFEIPSFPFPVDKNLSEGLGKWRLGIMYSRFSIADSNSGECRKIRILKFKSDEPVKKIYDGILAAYQDMDRIARAMNMPPEENYEICDAICQIEESGNVFFISAVPEYWPVQVSREPNVVPRFLRITNRSSEKRGKSKDFLLYEGIGENPYLQFIGQDIRIKAIFPCKKDTVKVIDSRGRCSYYNYKNDTWSDIFQLPIEGEVLDVVAEPRKHQVFWRKEGNALMSGFIKDKTIQDIRREEFGLEPAAIMDISGYKDTRCILTRKKGEDGKYQVSVYRKESHRSKWNLWKDIANVSIKLPPGAPKAMQGLQGSLSPIVVDKQNISWCVSVCDQTKIATTVYMIND